MRRSTRRATASRQATDMMPHALRRCCADVPVRSQVRNLARRLSAAEADSPPSSVQAARSLLLRRTYAPRMSTMAWPPCASHSGIQGGDVKASPRRAAARVTVNHSSTAAGSTASRFVQASWRQRATALSSSSSTSSAGSDVVRGSPRERNLRSTSKPAPPVSLCVSRASRSPGARYSCR